MIRLPPNSTLTDALFPYTTLFRSSAMGVQNILCLTGDGVQAGDQPGAKPVFDLDCMSLLSSVRTMRDEARFLSGRKLTSPPNVFLGAAINPFAPPYAFRPPKIGSASWRERVCPTV